MSNEIKTNTGRVVGHWNGDSAQDLMTEIGRIKQGLRQENSAEYLDSRRMPHRDQLPADLLDFRAYHLWGCDRQGACLVGTNANRIEALEKVRSFSLIEHH
ncbi:hypothetical protein EZJ19_13635 [Parasulfuritortus cantonensis]|uniref:Uncharacterized protein n=1 Tax=Parasulfuritortus cantonensis TaxID=2528202 RepID=A0A4R1B1K1_9PROT|nr:hypothetical protein [Parasulfuritortus cantonensis]TCJ11902.1 hypothetical protein EZJ19_13635 [Parasulfuritortus cantonensis]